MKHFVLDTNVLLSNPASLMGFAENNIMLPITVLEELDRFKIRDDVLGRNARESIRIIDTLRSKGHLSEGVEISAGLGKLSVFAENIEFNFPELESSADNYIIGSALRLNGNVLDKVVLITQDINMRIKADALGLDSQEYKNDQVSGVAELGRLKSIYLEPADMADLFKAGEIGLEGLPIYEKVCIEGRYAGVEPLGKECYLKSGQYVCVRGADGNGSTLAIVNGKVLKRLNHVESVYNVRPKNAEQHCLINALLDKDVCLVICAGIAGSGKTLLSMAAGMHYVDTNQVDRMTITKAIMPVGRDLGFLPGSKDEKLADWLRPFDDNLEYILRHKAVAVQELKDKGKIEVDAMTYVRGRSLMNRFVVVDEVQNLTAMEVKTLVTRIGTRSKLVLLGDITQIDNPYLDVRNNGLAHVMSRMNGQPGVRVLQMTKSERSELAELAVALL